MGRHAWRTVGCPCGGVPATAAGQLHLVVFERQGARSAISSVWVGVTAMSLMESVARLQRRRFGAGVFVIGGAGVLEWAKVFGDGGSLLQLAAGLAGVGLGGWFMARSSVRRPSDSVGSGDQQLPDDDPVASHRRTDLASDAPSGGRLRASASGEAQLKRGRAVAIFMLFAALLVFFGLVERHAFWFAFASLFLWLAVFAAFRSRTRRLDQALEISGGVVLLGVGAVIIWDREAVAAMAAAGRDRSVLFLYVVAPAFIVAGIFYAIRSATRFFGRRGRGSA